VNSLRRDGVVFREVLAYNGAVMIGRQYLAQTKALSTKKSVKFRHLVQINGPRDVPRCGALSLLQKPLQ
jgi:hypothetical protein